MFNQLTQYNQQAFLSDFGMIKLVFDTYTAKRYLGSIVPVQARQCVPGP